MIALLLGGLGLVALGGAAALLAGGRDRLASRLAAGAAVAGCLAGLVPAAAVATGLAAPACWTMPWSIPGGSLTFILDPLAAFFLLPTLLLSALAALYGVEYLARLSERRPLGPSWFCFNCLVVAMALVLLAGNAVLFLAAWEAMALVSFFLVCFEHERAEVREAGWIYLAASHLGTACLLAMFLILAGRAGSGDFARLGQAGALSPGLAGLLFVLGLAGFGAKAGFVPLHVWLPEAHPAAPSHVSALMSGVMIKTGIYGLVRLLIFLGPPPAWWGWTLVAVGLTSGILGVLFALAQHDLKRLLAYHSVENIGIIALGLGLGVLGAATGRPALAALGFAGALFHVLNHALFKGLLFLGAGAVAQATGTRRLDLLGGLGRRLPWTGAAFLVGAAAICGLPPLNGFASEFLIFLAALGAVAGGSPAAQVPALLVLAGLGLIGGLAVACFAKAFGIVFLGEPRTAAAAQAREGGWLLRLPQAALAAACVLLGLAPLALVGAAGPLWRLLPGGAAAGEALAAAGGPLAALTGAALFLAGLTAALAALRARLLARRPSEKTVTWDCGYARPTARMQYTATSFAQPLTALFAPLLRPEEDCAPPEGLFPRRAFLATHPQDLFRRRLFEPLFAGVERALGALRPLQHGRIQLYVLAIVATLLLLLAWKAG